MPDRDFVTIVSGLPRSGTSMMMQVLEAAGVPLLYDGLRPPDDDNTRGYYEFDPVKRTQRDSSWVAGAVGKAVKVVYKLLYDLPAAYRYRVLLLRRPLADVLASQRTMLRRQGIDDVVPDAVMADAFRRDVEAVDKWLSAQQNFAVLDVHFDEIIHFPHRELGKVAEFLGLSDVDRMCRAVDPGMPRNRTREAP